MFILPHARVPEHDRPAEPRTVVFVVSDLGSLPGATVAEVVEQALALAGVDQARAEVVDLTSIPGVLTCEAPCPGCSGTCSPVACETGACRCGCCCGDAYPLPAAASADDGAAALAQRTELHLDLADELLVDLALAGSAR